ncbi:hypothetical protein [Actinokineospora sp. UTMC 2448]|uniref:hypothetical protein n=1 Tax=Actinokineospora sp. UTMC 2448 TaxID=2268449 RepID=UPI0021643C35|nr:hypothetical protein [Actinokineospora sp. UTMC 2448]UVS78444.1 hypothetical protein Actkin_02177 [Actinokineospora sp. UTMC 2448]
MRFEDIVDPRLAVVLGSAAPALRAWGAARGLGWTLDRRLTEGRSGAVTAFVFERDTGAARNGAQAAGRKLLMKMDSCPDEDLGESEFARHRAALRDAPDFARLHLAELAPPGHDLVPVGDGRWIVFQHVAADTVGEGGVHDLDVLSKALASVAAGGPVRTAGEPTEGTISCAPDVLVGFSAHLVRTVLREWAGQPDIGFTDTAGYLREHIKGRLGANRPLRLVADRLTHDWMVVGDDRQALPNPFVLLRDESPLPYLHGRAHGDLHTGNVVVPVSVLAEHSPFRLVDLAKYSARAPLAADPAGFVLYVVTRVLRYLSESDQNAVSALLARAHDGPATPPWLASLVERVRAESERWASSYIQARDWAPQWRLSLVGAALVLLGRASTRVSDRMWLLRLAGRITAVHLGSGRQPARSGYTSVTPELLTLTAGRPESGAETWREWFCEYLPRLAGKASDLASTEQLDSLRASARAGEDRRADFLDLVRRLDGTSPVLRGVEETDKPVDEVLTCPLASNRCVRVVRPRPVDDEPRCALNRTRMRREFW